MPVAPNTALAVRGHPLYDQFLAALAHCSARQCEYLAELPANDYSPARTCRAIESRTGQSFSSKTPQRWLRNPHFQKAKSIVEQLAAEVVGVSQASVLARVNSLAEDAISNGDPVYHEGEEVGRKPARGDALRALEILARATDLIKPPEAPSLRVTLNLVDLTGRPEPIDVTPERPVLEAIDVTAESDPLAQ